jgi:hypothetical protein
MELASIEENLPRYIQRDILVMDYQYKNVDGDTRKNDILFKYASWIKS